MKERDPMTETPPTPAPADEDDTVQGVAKRAEVEIAAAQAIQDDLNAAAGMTPADPAAEPAPEPDAAPKASGKKPSA
jgi:hypothetical protein